MSTYVVQVHNDYGSHGEELNEEKPRVFDNIIDAMSEIIGAYPEIKVAKQAHMKPEHVWKGFVEGVFDVTYVTISKTEMNQW